MSAFKRKNRRGGKGSQTVPNFRLSGRGQVTTLSLRRGQICPDKMVVPLRYVQIQPINPNTSFTYSWAQNGVYDSDVTTGGATPAVGFTQWMGLYQRFRVLAATFSVVVVNNADADPIAISIAASEAAVLTTATAVQVASLKFAPYRDLTYAVQNAPPQKLMFKINTSELLGDRQYDEATLYGSATANPAKLFYFCLGATAINASAYQAAVEIEYLVEFSQADAVPGTLAYSLAHPEPPKLEAPKADPGVKMLPHAMTDESPDAPFARFPRTLVVSDPGSTCTCERCVR